MAKLDIHFFLHEEVSEIIFIKKVADQCLFLYWTFVDFYATLKTKGPILYLVFWKAIGIVLAQICFGFKIQPTGMSFFELADNVPKHHQSKNHKKYTEIQRNHPWINLMYNLNSISYDELSTFTLHCHPGLKILGGEKKSWGHNLPSFVEIVLTDRPKFGGACARPAFHFRHPFGFTCKHCMAWFYFFSWPNTGLFGLNCFQFLFRDKYHFIMKLFPTGIYHSCSNQDFGISKWLHDF